LNSPNQSKPKKYFPVFHQTFRMRRNLRKRMETSHPRVVDREKIDRVVVRDNIRIELVTEKGASQIIHNGWTGKPERAIRREQGFENRRGYVCYPYLEMHQEATECVTPIVAKLL
jgi:hypothetical protein